MRILNLQTATQLLCAQGVPAGAEVDKVLSGFDFKKTVYEQEFWPGDRLFQLMRMPSADQPHPSLGNWFGLAGVTTQAVAINDGLSGRQALRFKVAMHFTALEGSAKKLERNLGSGIGGAGRGTQVYLPRRLLGHLQSAGPVDRW